MSLVFEHCVNNFYISLNEHNFLEHFKMNSFSSDNKRVILEISGPMESSQNEVPTNVEEDDETYEKRWELKVENFKHDVIRGSFVMALFWYDPHNPDAGPELVGRQAEFRRWDEALCANCETRQGIEP